MGDTDETAISKDDYQELSTGLKELRTELESKFDKLARGNNREVMALQVAKVNHQKVLEEFQMILFEVYAAVDHISEVFQLGKRIQVPDREETFNRVKALLKETENK